ncbi:MAG: hypothetical protein HY927_12325 [Elusimicrobia bacterium]|nr:hypothetical protein [Elusimicrobiota bacterium]
MKDKCPRCGSTKVRYASSLIRHWARAVDGSDRRYCVACGSKWQETIHAGSSTRFLPIVALAAIIALGVAFVAMLSRDLSPDPLRLPRAGNAKVRR